MPKERNTMIKASGCLFLSTNTGRVLLQQRSPNVKYPGSWGFFGGKSEGKERPIETLLREIQEEIGSIPAYKKILPVSSFTSNDGKFVYHTFVIIVKNEFIPKKLNEESSGFSWTSIDNFPQPLHPGVKSQLSNKHIIQKIKTIQDDL